MTLISRARDVKCNDLKWVILFLRVDDFNGREPGQNFLGCVSHTLVHAASNHHASLTEYVIMQRQTMTFCQCKVKRITNSERREDFAVRIQRTSAAELRVPLCYKAVVALICSSDTPSTLSACYKAVVELICPSDTRSTLRSVGIPCNTSKRVLQYSLLYSDQHHVAHRFQLGPSRILPYPN
jgi:hypothetical protein